MEELNRWGTKLFQLQVIGGVLAYLGAWLHGGTAHTSLILALFMAVIVAVLCMGYAMFIKNSVIGVAHSLASIACLMAAFCLVGNYEPWWFLIFGFIATVLVILTGMIVQKEYLVMETLWTSHVAAIPIVGSMMFFLCRLVEDAPEGFDR